MSGRLEEPVPDGNGGTLDPKHSTNRDFLVALHVKLDDVVVPALNELKEWRREQENGDFTRGQTAAILEIVGNEQVATVERRNLRMPKWALIVSVLALVATAALTVVTIIQGVPHAG